MRSAKVPFYTKNERKKKQQNTEGKTAKALIGLEKRSGNVFAIVEYRLLFFLFALFGKRTLILPFKENFLRHTIKKNDRENKKGGVFLAEKNPQRRQTERIPRRKPKREQQRQRRTAGQRQSRRRKRSRLRR